MSIKKIAATAAAGALMLGAAMPAFGWFDNLVIIKNEDTFVTNDVLTLANTGFNGIFAEDVNGGSITTGNATAVSGVSNVVNTNVVDLCGCFDFDDGDGALVFIKNENTNVDNNVWTIANTGVNGIFASDDVNGGSIGTGNAVAAGVVTNVVNTNVVGGGFPL